MAKPIDGWHLLESGRYTEAIARFQEEYDKEHEAPFVFNIGVAQLCAGDASAAMKSFDSILESTEVSSANYAMSGVVRWIVGRGKDAVRYWKEGMKCQYADAAGGIELPLLLYYAAVRDSSVMPVREAKTLIAKALKHEWADCWPGPLGAFVMGRISETQLRKEAVFDQPDVMRRQQAQVDFYVGVKALELGDAEEFVRQMGHCASVPRWHLENEFYLAQYEATKGVGSKKRKPGHGKGDSVD